jgi:hypothetical protein
MYRMVKKMTMKNPRKWRRKNEVYPADKIQRRRGYIAARLARPIAKLGLHLVGI